jgi:hypothetical protein
VFLPELPELPKKKKQTDSKGEAIQRI